MLEVRQIKASYDGVPALHDVSVRVEAGEIVALVGSNGAGKSTTVRAISGVLHPEKGSIIFLGQRIDRTPAHQVVKMGIAHVPEGRHIFGRMTVLENLLAGAYLVGSLVDRDRRLQKVLALFPILDERRQQRAGTLSGGEQQMLAIGRALMSGPKLLILDEPSLGVAPNLALEIIQGLVRIQNEGTTVLLIEQAVQDALTISTRGYVLQTGRVVAEGKGKDLLNSDLIKVAYLGL